MSIKMFKNMKFSSHRVSLLVSFLLAVFLVTPHFAAALGVDTVTNGIKYAFGDGSFLSYIVFLILRLAVYIAGYFVYATEYLMSIFFNQNLYEAVLRSSLTGAGAVEQKTIAQIGWEFIRDFCNMFYMFFFLLIAFGTILRNQAYSAKALLPKVIISMFLINFSALIAQIVIDVGQVFFFGMVGWISEFTQQANPMTAIVDIFRDRLEIVTSNAGMNEIAFAAFALVYLLMLGVMYLIIGVFLLIRLISFVFLIIISPFAFFSMVLPSMKQYESKWWNSLIQNTLSGPVFVFFIFISTNMAVQLSGRAGMPIVTQGLGDFGNVIYALIPYIISIAMMYAAIPVTQALGAAGARQTLNFGKAAGMVGAGALAGYALGKKGHGFAYRRSKKYAGATEKVRDTIASSVGRIPGGVGAEMRLRARGEAAKQETIDNRIKSYGGVLKNMDIETLKRGDDVDKAIAVKAAQAQFRLGDSDIQNLFASHGSHFSKKDADELIMANPLLATLGAEGVRRVSDEMASSGVTMDEAKYNVMKKQMEYVVDKGLASKVQGLEDKTLARAWMDAQSFGQATGAMKNMVKKQKQKLGMGLADNLSDFAGDPERELKYASGAIKADQSVIDIMNSRGKGSSLTVSNIIDNMESNDIGGWGNDDLDYYGSWFTEKQVNKLIRSREFPAVQRILKSARKAGNNVLADYIDRRLV